MLSDWAKEEEKPVVFWTGDLRGRNSWYSGFSPVYQLRAALSLGWEYHGALKACQLYEGLEFLHFTSKPDQVARARLNFYKEAKLWAAYASLNLQPFLVKKRKQN